MAIVPLVLDLLTAAATALGAEGVSTAKMNKIAALVKIGASLASTATTASTAFVAALKAVTAQVQAMHDAGTEDLTDAEQASLDALVEQANAEIQAS